MPKGVYHHLLGDGSVHMLERFSCAPGPSGWRYVSQLSKPDGEEVGSVDVILDDLGRQLRVSLTSGDWTLRGGRGGNDLLWVRRPAGPGRDVPDDVRELRQEAAGFMGESPAFLLAVSVLVGEAVEPVRLRLVRLTGALSARRVDEQWQLVDTAAHQGELGELTVSSYQRVDLETGEQSDLHVSGDVVLNAPGIELDQLASAPNEPLLRRR